MTGIEVIGLLAGFLTTLASLPQLYKIIRHKRARDISLACYGLLVPGVLLWLVYGLSAGALAVIVWNSIALLTNGGILALKILDSWKARPEQRQVV
jgi:MtN3 and saliva related transmembrane protein